MSGAEANRLLKQYQRDGALPPRDIEQAGFATQGQGVTPGRVLQVAAQIALIGRWENDLPDDDIAAAVALPGQAGTVLVRGLRGDLTAARDIENRGLLTLENVLRLLDTVIQVDGLDDLLVEELMEFAEAKCHEVPGMGLAPATPRRGIETGPWDASEPHPHAGDPIDLGGLRLRREPGIRLDLPPSGRKHLAVTVIKGLTAIQLQAWSAGSNTTWESSRQTLTREVRATGGHVAEWAGRVGLELRAEVPVAGPGGIQHVRFIGCNGPGWLIRGVISGEGAAPDSREEWPYDVYQSTVVVPGHRGKDGDPISLREPRNLI